MWLRLKCSWSSNSLYLKTEHPEMLQLILWTSLTWLSQSACFTKHFSHCGHPTFLCLLFTCMLHSATLLKCLSQYLHFTWRSWQSTSIVSGCSVTWLSVTTGSGVTAGCSRSIWSRSISSFTRYCWHTLHLLCNKSKCLSKSQGNMNDLLHILHRLNSALWYLVMWLCLCLLLLKKWLHASHSLSYSPVRTSEPFTSSTSTWGSLLPARTLGSFGLGSSSGVGGLGGGSLWSPFSLDGSCWGVPTSLGSGSSGSWLPWSPTSTEVPRELISCLVSLWSSSLYSAEKRKKQMLQP